MIKKIIIGAAVLAVLGALLIIKLGVTIQNHPYSKMKSG